MISFIANRAESTITVASLFLGALSPFSSKIGVGAKSCKNKSAGIGSSAFNAFL